MDRIVFAVQTNGWPRRRVETEHGEGIVELWFPDVESPKVLEHAGIEGDACLFFQLAASGLARGFSHLQFTARNGPCPSLFLANGAAQKEELSFAFNIAGGNGFFWRKSLRGF
jgi:hypothetical protein